MILSDDIVMDHREIVIIVPLVYAHLNKGD